MCFHIQLDDSHFGVPINPYNVCRILGVRFMRHVSSLNSDHWNPIVFHLFIFLYSNFIALYHLHEHRRKEFLVVLFPLCFVVDDPVYGVLKKPQRITIWIQTASSAFFRQHRNFKKYLPIFIIFLDPAD